MEGAGISGEGARFFPMHPPSPSGLTRGVFTYAPLRKYRALGSSPRVTIQYVNHAVTNGLLVVVTTKVTINVMLISSTMVGAGALSMKKLA